MTPHQATSAHAAPRPRARRGAPSPRRRDQAERARSRGQRSTFEACCLPYRSELYAAALRMTRDPADAHDLVQETLLRAFQAWARFEPGTNCRAWLLRILTNSFINTYRRRRRHRRFASEHRGELLAAVYGEDQDRMQSPEEELLEGSLGDEVASALGALQAEHRQVVEMADLRGIRYREIAASLGVPVGTVMSRLFRARRRLEEQLAGFAAADYGIRRAA